MTQSGHQDWPKRANGRSKFLTNLCETGNKSISVSHRTPQRPEEFTNVLGQALRLLKGGEVPTPGHLGPALHIEEAFGPLTRRTGYIFGEERKPRGCCRRTQPIFSFFLYPSYSAGIHDVMVRLKR